MIAATRPPLRAGPTVDPEVMAEIRRDMELNHCKWDAQVGDVASLAPFPLVMTNEAWADLSKLAERLAVETERLELAVLGRPDLHAAIGLPRRLRDLYGSGEPTPSAGRVMRFDFHPTREGWRVSEVNSDVPGGYTEATSFTRLIAAQFPAMRLAGDPTSALLGSVTRGRVGGGVVALTCAPGHLEDQQVIAYLAARLREREVPAEVVPPTAFRWRSGWASLDTAWYRGAVSAIVRFYQAEWLPKLRGSPSWRPLLVGGRTPVSNPGISALSESKRLPLVWSELGVDTSTWQSLLPETRSLADAPWSTDDGWLLKGAYGNTGDTVSIRERMSRGEWFRRAWAARLNPRGWIAQRRFETLAIEHEGTTFYPCIGVYTVNGAASGVYGRISTGPVVDGFAQDVAVLVDPLQETEE